MEQKLFSRYISEFLETNFLEFMPTVKYRDDGSFDCDLKNESGTFAIWIATYNCEITIGIEDPGGETNIHTHISCYKLENLPSCVAKLQSYIENIKADQLILYQDEAGEYDWIQSSKYVKVKGSKKFSWKK